jgi:hypothetical protein
MWSISALLDVIAKSIKAVHIAAGFGLTEIKEVKAEKIEGKVVLGKKVIVKKVI